MSMIRARAAQERRAQLEDRERIARDLHDHVAYPLLATGLKVQTSVGLSRSRRLSARLHKVPQDIDVILQRLHSSIFRWTRPPRRSRRPGSRHAGGSAGGPPVR